MWEEWNEGGMGKLTERRKGGEPMKKRKPLSALGKAQMEMDEFNAVRTHSAAIK